VIFFEDSIFLQVQQYCTVGWKSLECPAMIISFTGFMIYRKECNLENELEGEDYVLIKPEIKHWMKASMKPQLIL
jgi:quercetin dioxygenase-like cupin family protein